MLQVFGIPNCGSVKKARAYFEAHNIDYEFVDFKKVPATKEMLTAWMQQQDWTILLNRKGTSYRALDEQTKNSIASASSAIDIILSNNSLIKRPVIVENGKIVTIGYDEAIYNSIFQ